MNRNFPVDLEIDDEIFDDFGNAIQCIVVAMLIESGKAMSFRQFGQVLGLTRLSMMTHYNDIEKLFRRR